MKKYKKLLKIFNGLLKMGTISKDSKIPCMVLLAVTEVGAVRKRVYEILPFSEQEIDVVFARCEKNGLFKNKKIYSDWFNKKTGDVQFYLDVLVAQGYIERT